MIFKALFIVAVLLAYLKIAICAKKSHLETNDVSDYSATTSINFIFDLFLKHYTNKLVEEGRTEIKTMDFDSRFTQRILFVDIKGSIEVKDGWCRNLSSLYRTGDSNIERMNGTIILSTHVGLHDLRIDYNSYNISLLNSHQKGKIHMSIGLNSLWLKMIVQTIPSCNITLGEFKIEELNNIQVDITNLGIFENLTDEITSWVIQEFRQWFKTYIDQILYPELSQVVKNADLCKYIPIEQNSLPKKVPAKKVKQELKQ